MSVKFRSGIFIQPLWMNKRVHYCYIAIRTAASLTLYEYVNRSSRNPAESILIGFVKTIQTTKIM